MEMKLALNLYLTGSGPGGREERHMRWTLPERTPLAYA